MRKPAALVARDGLGDARLTHRRLTTQRSISATAPAHTAMNAGTVKAFARSAPSSAGPSVKTINARKPSAIYGKAGLGGSTIDRTPRSSTHYVAGRILTLAFYGPFQ
jgi:hypothetical protein